MPGELMPGELAIDERVAEPNLSFKVNVVLRAGDEVLMQLKERFNDNTVGLLKEMCIFTLARLRSKKTVSHLKTV
jgi:hypothetical protein